MPFKQHIRTDKDTGVATRVLTLDGPFTPVEAAELQALGLTDSRGLFRSPTLDAILADYERNLQDADRPIEDAVNIRTRLRELRFLVDLHRQGKHHAAPLDAIVTIALDVGKRVAEAKAKHWPVTRDGKRVRAGRPKGGKKRVAALNKKADQLLKRFEEAKAQKGLSDEATARVYLSRQRNWLAGTDAERKKKINNLTRQIRRARNRNSGR